MSGRVNRELFVRHPNNPILTAADLGYPANTVFNPAATQVGDQTLLLLRVEDLRGMSHLTVARSNNGIDGWQIEPAPSLMPDPTGHPEELWGLEDPRITYLEGEGRYIVAYTAYSAGGPLVALAETTDFVRFDRLGPVMPPDDKDAALFPVKFGGRYALIHRPFPAHHLQVGAHIWLSFSPDLKHWGDHQILIAARRGGWWDAHKIGLSPPPLRTERGWLVLYHGVRRTASGCLYRLGLALLDLEDPRKVLRRSQEWVFAPMTSYEREGDVQDVVFPCGWISDGDALRIYYGGGDSVTCLATAALDEVLDWLDAHDSS